MSRSESEDTIDMTPGQHSPRALSKDGGKVHPDLGLSDSELISRRSALTTQVSQFLQVRSCLSDTRSDELKSRFYQLRCRF